MGKPDALSRRANHRNGASDNENIVLLRLEFLVVRALEGVELTGVEQKICPTSTRKTGMETKRNP